MHILRHTLLLSTGMTGLLSLCGCGPTVEEERVSLDLIEVAGVERIGEIATGGVPLPEGRVFDPAQLQVWNEKEQPVPTQAHQLGISWPDGSLRWALVQFPADVSGDGSARYFLGTDPVDLSDAPVVRAEETASGVVVDTGKLRFELHKEGGGEGETSFFPDRIQSFDEETVWTEERATVQYLADREHISREEFLESGLHPNALWSFGLGGFQGEYGEMLYNRYAQPNEVPWHDWSDQIERGIDYSAFFSGPMELEIEESGPVRAVVFFRRAAEGREGEIGYSGRLYAYADSTLLRVELTVENYEPFPSVPPGEGMQRELGISNTKHVRDFALHFRPAFQVEEVLYGGDDGEVVTVTGESASRLLQDREDRFRLAIDGEDVSREGQQASGWISVSGGDRSLTLACRFFHEIYPKALGYDSESNELILELWPPEGDDHSIGYPLTPGRVRTYQFTLGFDLEPTQVAAAARTELLPLADRHYMASTGAVHRFLPVDEESPFPALKTFIQRNAERLRRTMLRGDIHYGDKAGWSRLSTASGYHGVAHEYFVYYLATGDPALFRLAEAAAWHNLDIDQIHWGERAGEHVKQHTRGRDHTTLVRMGSIGVWNFGDVDYYFLTGKRRVLPALERTADFLMEAGGFKPGSLYDSRATSLPLMHLAYLFEAIGDERAVEELYPGRFPATDYPHRTDSAGLEKSKGYVERMRLVSEHLNQVFAEDDYRKVPFMVSYAPEGMYRFWRLTGDEAAREGVLRGTEFLYRETILPTGTPYFSGDAATHLQTDPLSIWNPWYDEVDLPAARAYSVTGDPDYLEYAKAPLDWRLLIEGIGTPYDGFNSTIPITLWYFAQAGLTQDDLKQPRPDLDYETALAEVKQKAVEGFELPMEDPGANTYFRLGLETARMLVRLGRDEEAQEWLDRMQEHWSGQRWEGRLKNFREALQPSPES